MTPPSAKRRPTIDDVAAEAGVSRGTVSRVLNGGHWVSPDSLQSVNSAIKKTGYRVNPHARSLATSRANSVAFLLTEDQERLFEDPNFAVLMRGASKALSRHDISLVLLMAGSEDEQRRATEFVTAGHVDGVLLVSSHSSRHGLISDIVAAGIPAIACGVPLGFERKLGYVAADDYDGAREMVKYLRGTGRARLATITGPGDTSGGMKRYQAYVDELGDDFDETLVAHGDYSRASGAEAMTELLDRRPDLDAVFVANDMMAAGAIDALVGFGRRVPEDVAVAGFDDAPVALTTVPPLTTMHQPFDRISEEMVRLLLEVIKGERTAAIVVPTDLIVRGSA
ncbi:LacI family transcriptional regulator [Cryobacterium algoricola]|uniref:LacI family transcriptional regulator n=2 Tax=Cryobacterium TaxID=69578 RepID=A0AA41UJA4_9MICO|nr:MULTISPECIES: LacI family DNA-binding transcriptional regulator [Cryobacterium]MCI4656766.1 LacI family transcriptional regulator [Cryobacterium zhongshanensis]TFB85301.1 LacI family transcriptional regulator [Cryobacterium algoricola]